MNNGVKFHFDRITFNNRWRCSRFGRSSDWVMIGFSKWWTGPELFHYRLSFLGFDLKIWIRREFL
jgi:hypothetical protein